MRYFHFKTLTPQQNKKVANKTEKKRKEKTIKEKERKRHFDTIRQRANQKCVVLATDGAAAD